MNLFNKNYPYHLPLLLAGAMLLLFPALGSVHLFDWDEINFAESAREMLASGDYRHVQINYEPFIEKPPLFFWLQALAMKIFGVNEFAARLPNAICGVITLVLFYKIGKKLYDGLFGFLWSLSYIGSFLPNLYFKSAIIDPVFNLFIFLGLYFLMQCIWSADNKILPKNNLKSIKNAVFAGIFTGLAVLTKGPVGFLLIFLSFVIFWVVKQDFKRSFRNILRFSFVPVGNLQSVLIYALVVFLVSCSWFALDVWERGLSYFVEFINYQIRLFTTPDAGHEQPFFYHFVVVFVGCFPMSAFGLRAFYYKNLPKNNNNQQGNQQENQQENQPEISLGNDFRIMMLCIFWVVMIIFSIAQTKIVHYSSMAYFPLSFLCAYALYHLLQESSVNQTVSRWSVFFVAFLGSIFGLALTILPIAFQYKEKFYYLIRDGFAVACLSQDVFWSGWEFLIGVFYLVFIWLGVYYFSKKLFQKAILTLFLSTAVFLSALTVIIAPKIEAYFQKPMIDFYESLADKDVYVISYQFRSYGQYFYKKVPKYTHPKAYNYKEKFMVEQWLLRGDDVDKPAYFVSKINDTVRMKIQEPMGVKKIYQKGGFAFYERKLQKK